MSVQKAALAIMVCILLAIRAALPGYGKAAVVPTAGAWTGANVSFNISEDGTQITAINSPLTDGSSLTIDIKEDSSPVSMKLMNTIPVQNGRFHYQSKIGKIQIKIDGKFKSSDEASGSVSYSGSVTFSTWWTAAINQ